VPEENDGLRSARMLLATFLASQLAGSPHDVLVEQQGVTDGITAGVTRQLPGLYRVNLSAEPTPDTSPQQLADAMRRYVDEWAGRRFDPAILERLKRRFAADHALASLSGERVMNRVVSWVANGEAYDRLAVLPQHIAETTEEDATRLLAAFAGPGRELTGFLLPEAARDGSTP
jgi:predicted Zn-dependent peptidase